MRNIPSVQLVRAYDGPRIARHHGRPPYDALAIIERLLDAFRDGQFEALDLEVRQGSKGGEQLECLQPQSLAQQDQNHFTSASEKAYEGVPMSGVDEGQERWYERVQVVGHFLRRLSDEHVQGSHSGEVQGCTSLCLVHFERNAKRFNEDWEQLCELSEHDGRGQMLHDVRHSRQVHKLPSKRIVLLLY